MKTPKGHHRIISYTTSINCEKTIMEIQKVLVSHGATKIVTDYENGIPNALTFCLSMGENLFAFSLPANYEGVLRAMKNDGKIPKKFLSEEQALKVSWRIILTWTKAQMALVEAELADVAEVFLPYAVTKNGGTLYNEIEASGMLLLKLNK